MIKKMSRIIVVVVALASMLAIFSGADAQYEPTDPITRGSQIEVDSASANSGFLGFSSVNPQPSGPLTVSGPTADTGGGLALTGSETDLGLALGIGLLAVGGTAIVASRKRDDE